MFRKITRQALATHHLKRVLAFIENADLPSPKSEGKAYIKTEPVHAMPMQEAFEVETLEGKVTGKPGDYLCQGEEDEKWPIKKEIFEKTYKPVKN